MPGLLQASRVVRFARMARMLKVVKLLRLPRVLKHLEDMIGRAVLSILSFVVIGLLMMHWMACLFWFVGSLSAGNDSWIGRYSLNSATDSAK